MQRNSGNCLAKAIQDSLAAGQNEFTKGDYSTVLDSAKELTGKVKTYQMLCPPILRE